MMLEFLMVDLVTKEKKLIQDFNEKLIILMCLNSDQGKTTFV